MSTYGLILCPTVDTNCRDYELDVKLNQPLYNVIPGVKLITSIDVINNINVNTILIIPNLLIAIECPFIGPIMTFPTILVDPTWNVVKTV